MSFLLHTTTHFIEQILFTQLLSAGAERDSVVPARLSKGLTLGLLVKSCFFRWSVFIFHHGNVCYLILNCMKTFFAEISKALPLLVSLIPN